MATTLAQVNSTNIDNTSKLLFASIVKDLIAATAAAQPATTTVAGVVKKAATVANCTVATDGTSAGTQLNALLTSLRAAGMIV